MDAEQACKYIDAIHRTGSLYGSYSEMLEDVRKFIEQQASEIARLREGMGQLETLLETALRLAE